MNIIKLVCVSMVCVSLPMGLAFMVIIGWPALDRLYDKMIEEDPF